VFYRGLRTVAVDGTHLDVPDDPAITWRYPRCVGERQEFGYPLLRLAALVECGTRAVLAAAFGPDTAGELACARALLGALDATMLLLADAGFDAAEFVRDVTAAGAQFLVRSAARRCPTALRHLPDGSCLARIGYGVLPALLAVRVIEAAVTIPAAAGTARTEQWRLLTSLPDPAAELIALYHERWQAETTYYSIKATILDGRVLRSRTLTGLDQETWALLAAYQALIRAAADTAATRPGLDTDRISFTIVLQTATRLVTTATGILPHGPPDLAGQIGRPPWPTCSPPGAGPAPNHAPARTPPPSTGTPPHSQPTARPTPSPPASPSSKKDLRPATTLNATALTAMLKSRPPAPGLASALPGHACRECRPSPSRSP
jgi:hypothetical protein